MKKIHIGLLPRIIIAILLGIAVGHFFPAERVDDHVTFLFGLADRVEQPLPSLDEEQENQQCAQQADQEPPIVL